MVSLQRATDPQTHFILTGNLWRVLWQLAWPAVLGMLLFGLNGFIDALYVGQLLGETALAGVSLAVPLMQLQMGLGAMVGTGAGAVLSLAIGAKDVSTQRKLWGNLVLLSVALALPATVLTAGFAPELIGWMGGTGEPLRLGAEFYRTYALGSLLTIFGIGGNMFIRGEGRLRESMLLAAVGLVANITLNPLYIVTLGLGVSGAALATITANGLMAIGTLWYYRSGRGSFPIDLSRYRLDTDVAGPIAKIGFSALIMSVMTVVQGLVVFNALTRYGSERDVAFYGAASRILLLCMTPAFGLMRALQPGDSLTLTLKAEKTYRGFTQSGDEPQPDLMANGSFGSIRQFLPIIGYDSERELTENRKRAEQGLPKLTSRMAPVSDSLALTQNADAPDADWPVGTLILSTDRGQTPVGPGRLVRQWQQGGRQYAEFRVEQPDSFDWYVGSGIYRIVTATDAGVQTQILADPKHSFNVAYYQSILPKAVQYVRAQLGSYPYTQVRVVEIPYYQQPFYAMPAGHFRKRRLAGRYVGSDRAGLFAPDHCRRTVSAVGGAAPPHCQRAGGRYAPNGPARSPRVEFCGSAVGKRSGSCAD